MVDTKEALEKSADPAEINAINTIIKGQITSQLECSPEQADEVFNKIKAAGIVVYSRRSDGGIDIIAFERLADTAPHNLSFSAGKIDSDDPTCAALREVDEEIGLQTKITPELLLSGNIQVSIQPTDSTSSLPFKQKEYVLIFSIQSEEPLKAGDLYEGNQIPPEGVGRVVAINEFLGRTRYPTNTAEHLRKLGLI